MQLVLNPSESVRTSPVKAVDSELVKYAVKGYFKSREELDEYEKTWHLFIYQPTWNELKKKVSTYVFTPSILMQLLLLQFLCLCVCLC